jgi:hypothetical protein
MGTQELLNTRLVDDVLTHYSQGHFFWLAKVIPSHLTTDLKGYLATSSLRDEKKVVQQVKG